MGSGDFGWLVPGFRDLDFVTSADLDGAYLTIERVDHPRAKIGLLTLDDVDAGAVVALLDGSDGVDAVINTPRGGRFMGDALDICRARGVGWGGIADAYRALRDEDRLVDYVPRELAFVLRGLNQHDRVEDTSLLDDHRIFVRRVGLPPLVLFVGSMYQPTADSVRSAVDRYGGFDVFCATIPNSQPTSEALAAGEALGVRVLRWGPTLGALNY